jgi:hypothetical protein
MEEKRSAYTFMVGKPERKKETSWRTYHKCAVLKKCGLMVETNNLIQNLYKIMF